MGGWLVRGGRLRMAVVLGLPAGLLAGGGGFVNTGSAATAVGTGVLVAVLTGVVVFRWMPGWWRIGRLSELPPSDRVAVLRAVRRGEPVSDPRLAPAVLAYAQVVASAARRNQAQHWWFYVIVAVTLALGVWDAATGSARGGAYWSAVAAMALGLRFILLRTGALERQRQNADEAARLARE